MNHRVPYPDRAAAGDALAAELRRYAGRDDLVVLGLPRGGVPVAARVAAALAAPLDALVVRKVGVPGQPELAMGAVAGVAGGIEVVRNDRVIRRAGVDDAAFAAALRDEVPELRRREHAYRGDRPPAAVTGRTVIVVDDGLATGATMRAAVAAIRRQGPGRVVVAAPIGAGETCLALETAADEVVCPWTPGRFDAVSQGYRDFAPTADDEVRALLG
jgi:predicted phosphoribosyltransferase